MKDATKKLINKIYEKLDELFPTEPKDFNPSLFGRKEETILDVSELLDGIGNEDECAEALEELKNHRMAKTGLFFYGVQVLYHPDTEMVAARDIHACDIRVYSKDNEPYANVRFVDGIKELDDDGRIICNARDFTINAGSLEDCLYDMKWSDGADHDHLDGRYIRYNPDSIRTFYKMFKDQKPVYFIRMTKDLQKSFAESWTKDVYRYDPNMTSSENGWGLTFAMWQDHLVEDYNGLYFSEDITEEEVEMLTGKCRGSFFDKEIRRYYNAVNHKEDHAGDVAKFESMKKNLQNIVDKNSDDLLSRAGRTLRDALKEQNEILGGQNALLKKADNEGKHIFEQDELRELDRQLHDMENRYFLDCGWVSFMFLDDESDDIARNASINGSQEVFSDGSFWLNMPYNTQSTTVQRSMADGIVKLAGKEGIKLGYTVTLN